MLFCIRKRKCLSTFLLLLLTGDADASRSCSYIVECKLSQGKENIAFCSYLMSLVYSAKLVVLMCNSNPLINSLMVSLPNV